ncbi:MAG: DEAD/DEAH box helicase [Myxococcales bacterium]|nr:DEAD/DEAH box helicase [Myxococcales bacterium]
MTIDQGEVRADPRYTSYQREFFERFVSKVDRGSIHLLLAPIGTGKSFVTAGSIAELLRIGRLRRVLIMSPAALASQWAYMLGDIGCDTAVVDGRALRLLLEQVGSSFNDWPIGSFSMSIDLGKRPPVHDAIVRVPWDLVVVDNAHALGGQRLQLIEDFAARENAPALLLLAANNLSRGTAAFVDQAIVVDWTAAINEIRGPVEERLHRVTCRYSLANDELTVMRGVCECALKLEPFRGLLLLHRAASSVSTLEETLLRWLADCADSSDSTLADAFGDLLDDVEQLRVDSKLDCFQALIQELIGDQTRHVVAFCEYRATLEYLAAAVERLEFPDYRLHGGLSAGQRADVLDRFERDGGLLVTTGASETVSLGYVDAAIHYDLPLSAAAFAQREGRYDRFGRRGRCSVFFFEDEAQANPLDGLLLKLVANSGLVTVDQRIEPFDVFGTDHAATFSG